MFFFSLNISYKFTILKEHVDIKKRHLPNFSRFRWKIDVLMFTIHIVNKKFNMFRSFEQNKNVIYINVNLRERSHAWLQPRSSLEWL